MSNFAQPIEAFPTDENVREWLAEQMKDNQLLTLLAFADDGIIWGRWDGSSLVIAHDIDGTQTELRGKTLQQAFAFSADMEVRLFRDELGEWKAWKIKDAGEVIKENQILWGDKQDEKQPAASGFLRLLAERKGISPQLIPVNGTFTSTDCVHMEVHHLVDYNDHGEAYIVTSRLAEVKIGKKAEEV